VTKKITKKITKTTISKPAKKSTKKFTKTTAKQIVGFALEKKAFDVKLMDLRKITSMTDFFIVCSGSTGTQVKAIADSVTENCKKAGMSIHNVEGYDSLRWVLIDLVDVVIHVFQPEVRNYYQLERLWGDAPTDDFDDENEKAAS
jgi:ribosome-associated protein